VISCPQIFLSIGRIQNAARYFMLQ